MAKFPLRVVDMAKVLLADLEGTAFTEEEAQIALEYFQGSENLFSAPNSVKRLLSL
jgi:hypothetical protein